MEKAASDMDEYVERVEAEIPLFSLNLDEGMNVLIDSTKLMVEFGVSEADRSKARTSRRCDIKGDLWPNGKQHHPISNEYIGDTTNDFSVK